MAESAQPGDYERSFYDEVTGKYVSYKGNFIADDNAIIHWLTPEELESFSEAERIAKEGEEELTALVRKVLARELPGWQDQLPPEHDKVAFATAWKLMRPEEVLQRKELGKPMGEAYRVLAQLQKVAEERKGSPL
jgi:hypothetical protein